MVETWEEGPGPDRGSLRGPWRAAATARAAVPEGGSGPAAIVLDVDLAQIVSAIPGRDKEGNRQSKAWVLAREAGRPVGLVTLDIPESGLDSEAVKRALEEATAVESRPRPPRAAVPAGRADVTVVVCTRERPDALRRALASLVAQRHRPFRVLVVDNAPQTEATKGVVEQFASELPMTYVVEPRKGLSRARNAALTHLPKDIVAWLDDDEEADPNWVGEIVLAFAANPGASAVSGVVIPAELQTKAQVWFEQFGGHSKGRGFTEQVLNRETLGRQSPLFPLPPFGVGANMAFRAQALHAVAGFDEALGAGTLTRGGEDTKVFSQLLLEGRTVVYWPGAITKHYHRSDLAGLESQLRGYGSGLTAYYTAIIADNPRNLLRLLQLAPLAIRALFGGDSLRVATIGPDFPVEILRANKRAMLAGPFLYVRERLRNRRDP